MDYLDPVKRRAHTIRLFIGYGLMTIVVLLAAFILLLQAYGYDLNRHTGQVIQNGLIYLSSHPVSATVYENGQNKGTTSLKLVIPANTYNFELRANGYRSWKKTVNLAGGTIEQLVYPFLFPSKLTTTDQQQYAEVPQLATQSPDRRWLLIQPSGPLTHFMVFDLSNVKAVQQTTFDLPAELLTSSTGAQKLELVEWSTDNKHVLLKHTYAESSEYIMVDRSAPEISYNVNKVFGINPTTVALRDKRFDRLYFYDATNQTVSTADFKTKLVQPLLTKVLTFKPFGADTVLYVANDNLDPTKYSVKIWDGSHSYQIHTYPAGTNYLLEMASYSGSDYALVVSTGKGIGYIYKDPLSRAKSGLNPAVFTLLQLSQPQFVSFSDNTRFIALQSANKFAVYDIDMDRHFNYQIDASIASGEKANWMDGHRLDLINNGHTEVFDFDGTNSQILTANLPGIMPFFDSGYSALYDIGPSLTVPQHYALTQTPLKASP